MFRPTPTNPTSAKTEDRHLAGGVLLSDLLVEVFPLGLTGHAPAARAIRRHAPRREARREQIAALWDDGHDVVAIAEALGSTKGSIGVEMTLMRHDGWDLPYRRRWTGRSDLLIA